MSNTEKKLDALIDALGFDVEVIRTPVSDMEVSNWNNQWRAYPLHARPGCTFDYKLTKRDKTKEKPKGIKCYRVFDHENEQLFRTTYIKPDLDCKIEEFYDDGDE